MAASALSLAVPWITPPPPVLVERNESGSPTIPAIQSMTRVSISVAAGLVAQSIPLTSSPALSISPRMPGPEPLHGKYAKKLGDCQCVIPGITIRSRSAKTASYPSGAPFLGGPAGIIAATCPGLARDSTGSPSTRSMYSAIHSTTRWPWARNSSGVMWRGSLNGLLRQLLQLALHALYEPRDRVGAEVELQSGGLEEVRQGPGAAERKAPEIGIDRGLLPFFQALEPELQGPELGDAVLDVVERGAEQVHLPLPLRRPLALQPGPRDRVAEPIVQRQPRGCPLLAAVRRVGVHPVLEPVNRRDPGQDRAGVVELDPAR